MADIISAIRASIQCVTHPRFFETERGYQGQLGAELTPRLSNMEILSDHFVEHEYQKNLKEHGLRIRPDLVIHVPFDGDVYDCRKEGNHAVVELKLKANQRSAHEDFNSLAQMIEKLDYDIGVFINISSPNTFLDSYEGQHKNKIKAFGVTLENGTVSIHE